MTHFQNDGLDVMVPFHGRHVPLIPYHWIFSCGAIYVKDIVYRTKVRDVSDLQQRMIEALDTVTVDMLARTWLEIEYRLDILRATDGAHVEVY